MRLSEFLRLQFEKRYSGAVVLHFQNGIPRLIEIPQTRIPLRETLDNPAGESAESRATA